MSDAFFQGITIGRYELISRLSIGGMAELFLAKLVGPGGFEKLVALKMILPDVRQDERFVQMFLDEAKVTAELNHPNVGQVFELGQEPTGELYLALEFLFGQNLSALIRAQTRAGRLLPISVAVSIVRDMCLGLHAAHVHVDPLGVPRPVIHRDIAPKNVMVTYSGQVKVIDFGIALTSGRRVRTMTGVVKGTPSYMAPEQLAGEKATVASDIFAVGITLFECLTGERLFTVGLRPEDYPKALRRPSEVNRDVPPKLDEVCARALAMDPAQRFSTAREFARALAEAVPELADNEERSLLMRSLFSEEERRVGQFLDVAKDSTRPKLDLDRLARQAFSATPAAEPAPPVKTLTTGAGGQPAGQWRKPALVATVATVTALGLAALLEEDRPKDPGPSPIARLRTGPPPPNRPVSAPTVSPIDRANAELAKQDWVEALRAFDEVLSVRPDDWRALYGSSQALLGLGRADDAAVRLERAAALPPGTVGKSEVVDTFTALAGCRLRSGDREKAIDALASMLIRFPDAEIPKALADFRELANARAVGRQQATGERERRTQELLKDGLQALDANRYAAAIPLLEQCLNLDPTQHQCALGLGMAYSVRAEATNSASDRTEAVRLYTLFLQLAPSNDPARSEVVATLELEAQTKRAPPRLTALDPRAPADEKTRETQRLLGLANAAKKEQKYTTAIQLLKDCLRLERSNPDCTVSLASTYAQLGSSRNNDADNEEARRLYREFLKVARPADPRVERVKSILRGDVY